MRFVFFFVFFVHVLGNIYFFREALGAGTVQVLIIVRGRQGNKAGDQLTN